jgi:2-keto-4-pentenoate hydratase/2-oxohepta-3-ene-1,7-dioic acid hydratase in catechol pathway
MKLARFEADGHTRIGVVAGDGLICLTEVGFGYSDMFPLIAAGPDELARIRDRTAPAAPHYRLDDVRLLAPLRPGKYLAIGMNYARHVAEMGHAERPQYQYWFNKQTTCINGPFDPIEPGVTGMLDYEVELGVVIGRAAKGVKSADALDYVFGYLVANDVSARDWQREKSLGGGQFARGKSFDGFCPLGPHIVTRDEIPNPNALRLKTILNGQTMQDHTTADMIFDVPALIESLSSTMTLRPGAVLLTGTPQGVGFARTPPVWMKPGDHVAVEIEKIGRLENLITSEA